MLQYSAEVRTNNGSTVSYPVTAKDRRSAARELSVSPSRVMSVKIDWLLTLKAANSKSSGPSPTEQAIFLLNLAAQLTGGKRAPAEVIDAYLARDKRFTFDRIKKEKAIEVEDYLDALDFDQNILILAKAGRESGDLAGALREAAEYLQEEEARKGAIMKKITGGIFYAAAAVNMAIFGSMGFSAQLRQMEEDIGIPFEYNLASNTLFALDYFFTNYGIFVLAALGVAIVFRKPILKAGDGWPIVSQINRISRIQRGITFLSLFSLLRRSDKTDKDSLNYIASHARGEDAEIFNRLATVKSRGQPLHTGFREDEWSPTILAGLGQIEELDNDSAFKTMRAILGGQKQELTKAGESLATTLQLGGMISLVVIILVTIIGFLLPILSVTTSPTM